MWIFNNLVASILTALCLIKLLPENGASPPEFTKMFESELMGSGYLATGYVIGSVVRECVVIIGQAVSGRWISTLDTAVYSLVTLVVDFYALGTIVMACSQAYQSDLSSAALIKAFLCTTAGPGFLFSILSGLVRCLTAIGFYLRYKEVPHSE